MKKLKLKLGDKTMLSKDQMRKVVGGYDDGCYCAFYCYDGGGNYVGSWNNSDALICHTGSPPSTYQIVTACSYYLNAGGPNSTWSCNS